MSPLKYPIRAPLSIKWSWKREVENLKEKASKLNETKKYLAYISLAIHKPMNRRCFTCESDHCYKVYCRIPCNARCRHNHTFTPIDGAGGAGRDGRPEFPPSCPKDLLRGESQIHATYYWLIIIYLFIYLFMNLHDLSFRTCELEAKMTNVHPRGSVLEIHSEIDMKWKHMISVRTCKIYNRTSIIPIKRSSAIQRPVTKVLLDKIVT